MKVANRYSMTSTPDVYLDEHLDRDVWISWIGPYPPRTKVLHRIGSLQGVRSPHIALAYDLVSDEGRAGVVQETLGDEVVFEDSTSLSLLLQASLALHALHSDGLCHGGTLEGSYRQSEQGLVKLCDFDFEEAPNQARIEGEVRELVGLIRRAVTIPKAAWTAKAVVEHLRDELMRGRHRALIVYRGRSIELSDSQRQVVLKHPNADVAKVRIGYTGTRFEVTAVKGEVFVNNKGTEVGAVLPTSCVVSLGASSRAWADRHFITFDRSHPEPPS